MNKKHPFPRLKPILKYAPKRLAKVAAKYPEGNWNVEYRWEHSLRVAHYGAEIARAEGANLEHTLASCLLHDVARFDPGDPLDHGRLGAKIIEPKLLEWGFTEKESGKICYAVASHVGWENPETLLAKVVTDADNIDRFSALRILHFCQPNISDYPKLIRKTKERLEYLEKLQSKKVMMTKTGQALFDQQIERMIHFFRDLVAEKALTKYPPPAIKDLLD